MNRLFKNKKGVTMAEIIMAALLLSLIFLAVSSLYVASQKFYLGSSQKVIIGYEAQYAIQHIYKYAMKGIGDKNTPAFQIYSLGVPALSGDTVDINISNNDPLTMANYGTNITNYRYRYDADAKKIYFKVGSGSEEDLIPKISVTAVNFTKTTNALTGYITAYYSDPAKALTFYFSCYPRQASFN